MRTTEASITLESRVQAVRELAGDGEDSIWARIKEGSQKVQTQNQTHKRAFCKRINPKVKSQEGKEKLPKKVLCVSRKKVQELS